MSEELEKKFKKFLGLKETMMKQVDTYCETHSTLLAFVLHEEMKNSLIPLITEMDRLGGNESKLVTGEVHELTEKLGKLI